MSETCKWLHSSLEVLPVVKYPFELSTLPQNGIYFFYESGEFWGHGSEHPRIVRIGTHREGNFRSRIREHFLLNEASKMNFDAMRPAPHERSIFRKNIGRALLNRDNDPYLRIWEMDFTSHDNRERFGGLRNIQKEKHIETEITRILRENFSFRYIPVDNQAERMGAGGLEGALIGTVHHCEVCKPSSSWLGSYSPKKEIRESGLWLVQHLRANGLDERGRKAVSDAIGRASA